MCLEEPGFRDSASHHRWLLLLRVHIPKLTFSGGKFCEGRKASLGGKKSAGASCTRRRVYASQHRRALPGPNPAAPLPFLRHSSSSSSSSFPSWRSSPPLSPSLPPFLISGSAFVGTLSSSSLTPHLELPSSAKTARPLRRINPPRSPWHRLSAAAECSSPFTVPEKKQPGSAPVLGSGVGSDPGRPTMWKTKPGAKKVWSGSSCKTSSLPNTSNLYSLISASFSFSSAEGVRHGSGSLSDRAIGSSLTGTTVLSSQEPCTAPTHRAASNPMETATGEGRWQQVRNGNHIVLAKAPGVVLASSVPSRLWCAVAGFSCSVPREQRGAAEVLRPSSWLGFSKQAPVRLCQPVSQVLEHVIHAPVTQRGPGVGVEGPGAVGTLGTTTEAAVEDVVVVLVVVLVVLKTLVVLCTGVDFGWRMSGADGCCGANLDHQGFLEGPGPHAVKPLVPLAPAAVVEHRAVERDDRLGGGDHELAVEKVVFVGPSESQVGGVADLVLALVLTDLNVGGANRDLHHRPLFRGGGLLHRRWANWIPPPHVLEHAPQGPQELQLPWLDAWEVEERMKKGVGGNGRGEIRE
ncbi:hypothetical protein EYF80_039170 [Liparis tanakae]|uniref:Uncharacterized protein n=1 Tax=Liparis tanakae TaxID=230148 RepID=A0A4Z2GAN8_9TELE|nr:hypothetical protein EYF80_039170 [Liparis tanakae]